VDEGNNWVNITWGPLALMGPTGQGTGTAPDTFLGNYVPASGTSPTVNRIPAAAGGVNGAYTLAPDRDFFGTLRKNGFVDAGAVEFLAGGGGVGSLATVSPTSLAFGNWAVGTTSNPMFVTVTNTGSVALAGGTFTIPAGSRFTRSGGTCGAALAVGANCTVGVVFAPNAVAAFNDNLTVAYTGATVTGSPVALSGSGVAARGTVGIAPNPLTITLPSGSLNFTGTGTVTLTNTTAAGGSSVAVTGVSVTGGTIFTYFFTAVGGSNTCTGANLAPGASCTVGVRFTNVLSPRGTNRAGTITFTDTATGSPQAGGLIGFATP